MEGATAFVGFFTGTVLAVSLIQSIYSSARTFENQIQVKKYKEDELELGTLVQLTKSLNLNLKNSAIGIVLSRLGEERNTLVLLNALKAENSAIKALSVLGLLAKGRLNDLANQSDINKQVLSILKSNKNNSNILLCILKYLKDIFADKDTQLTSIALDFLPVLKSVLKDGKFLKSQIIELIFTIYVKLLSNYDLVTTEFQDIELLAIFCQHLKASGPKTRLQKLSLECVTRVLMTNASNQDLKVCVIEYRLDLFAQSCMHYDDNELQFWLIGLIKAIVSYQLGAQTLLKMRNFCRILMSWLKKDTEGWTTQTIFEIFGILMGQMPEIHSDLVDIGLLDRALDCLNTKNDQLSSVIWPMMILLARDPLSCKILLASQRIDAIWRISQTMPSYHAHISELLYSSLVNAHIFSRDLLSTKIIDLAYFLLSDAVEIKDHRLWVALARLDDNNVYRAMRNSLGFGIVVNLLKNYSSAPIPHSATVIAFFTELAQSLSLFPSNYSKELFDFLISEIFSSLGTKFTAIDAAWNNSDVTAAMILSHLARSHAPHLKLSIPFEFIDAALENNNVLYILSLLEIAKSNEAYKTEIAYVLERQFVLPLYELDFFVAKYWPVINFLPLKLLENSGAAAKSCNEYNPFPLKCLDSSLSFKVPVPCKLSTQSIPYPIQSSCYVDILVEDVFYIALSEWPIDSFSPSGSDSALVWYEFTSGRFCNLGLVRHEIKYKGLTKIHLNISKDILQVSIFCADTQSHTFIVPAQYCFVAFASLSSLNQLIMPSNDCNDHIFQNMEKVCQWQYEKEVQLCDRLVVPSGASLLFSVSVGIAVSAFSFIGFTTDLKSFIIVCSKVALLVFEADPFTKNNILSETLNTRSVIFSSQQAISPNAAIRFFEFEKKLFIVISKEIVFRVDSIVIPEIIPVTVGRLGSSILLEK